ncbi:MAG: hypothetical protein GX984_00725 [Erysipelothrix sp.]|nr:hypothetical protein [Erysipelothrix sp.]
MTICKHKDCSNQVTAGEKRCKYHQAIREENSKKLIALGGSLVLGGIGLIRKIKK